MDVLISFLSDPHSVPVINEKIEKSNLLYYPVFNKPIKLLLANPIPGDDYLQQTPDLPIPGRTKCSTVRIHRSSHALQTPN